MVVHMWTTDVCSTTPPPMCPKTTGTRTLSASHTHTQTHRVVVVVVVAVAWPPPCAAHNVSACWFVCVHSVQHKVYVPRKQRVPRSIYLCLVLCNSVWHREPPGHPRLQRSSLAPCDKPHNSFLQQLHKKCGRERASISSIRLCHAR